MIRMAEIRTPTLLLDERRARRNLEQMAAKARRLAITFRPHFKTHQSAAIGNWFREVGVDSITVSSVKMANYFAAAGWDDMTIAFPVNLRELSAIDDLAGRVELGLLVDSLHSLEVTANGVHNAVGIWLEVDTGYSRSGIPWNHFEQFNLLCRMASRHPHLRLRGLLSHSGHSYGLTGPDAVAALHGETLIRMTQVRDSIERSGFGRLVISVGDTPTCSMLDDLGEVDEMRPGNFLFFDWMQFTYGSCRQRDIAVCVACPVVAVYPDRREMALYGGAVHLSKDSVRRMDGAFDFGALAPLNADGWSEAHSGTYLRSLSQEHGIARAVNEDAFASSLARYSPGDLVGVLPIHSCLTADLHKRFLTLDGTTLAMMQ
jgi:D-serine deaminase-like pyridoxal phosphate-dependent protein